MARKLNLPKQSQESKFEQVDFVETMTPYQLKCFINNMWESIGDLATVCEEVNPSITNAIDTMRDGGTWSDKQIRERFRFTYLNGIIVCYDSKTDQFRFMDMEGNVAEKEAMNKKHFDKALKKELK